MKPSDLPTAPVRRIGGTDAGKLLGLSKYGNARDVYERIVNGIDSPTNPRMARGTANEHVVRALCATANPDLRTLWTPEPWIVRHPTHEFATCSPDDVTADTLLEYKTASIYSAKRWGYGDGVPSEYLGQVLWSLWVTQLPRALLCVAFGIDGDDGAFEVTECRQYWLERDAEMEATFAEVGGAFWRDHVLARRPPDVEPVKNKRKVKKLYADQRTNERKEAT